LGWGEKAARPARPDNPAADAARKPARVKARRGG
jgi:hypothetical protein